MRCFLGLNVTRVTPENFAEPSLSTWYSVNSSIGAATCDAEYVVPVGSGCGAGVSCGDGGEEIGTITKLGVEPQQIKAANMWSPNSETDSCFNFIFKSGVVEDKAVNMSVPNS